MFVAMNARTLFFILVFPLAITSCVRDLHEQIVIPDPPCVGAMCDCVDGFEGPKCNFREIEKFLGSYEEGEASCPEGERTVGKHTVSDSKYGVRFIEINDGLHDLPIHAEIDGWNFTIPEQTNSISDKASGKSLPENVRGFGWLDLDGGKLVYQLYNQQCQIELKLK